MSKIEIDPEDQKAIDTIAAQYAPLKEQYKEFQEMSKSALADMRAALEAMDEKIRLILDKYRDEKTDRAKVRTPEGTFSTSLTGNYKVRDSHLLQQAIIGGSVPLSIVGDEVNRKKMHEYLEKEMKAKGFYDLSPEEKDRANYQQYMPPGVEFTPFERIMFRPAR